MPVKSQRVERHLTYMTKSDACSSGTKKISKKKKENCHHRYPFQIDTLTCFVYHTKLQIYDKLLKSL